MTPRNPPSRLARNLALAALLWACASPGCAAAQRAPGRDVPAVPPSGWTIPEDSVDALFAFSNLVRVHHRMSGPYPANIVTVFFRPGATAAQRRRALGAVGGRVVGGDGVHHYIQVYAGCEDRPVWCAIDRLAKLPQVEDASPFMMGGFSNDEAILVPPDSGGSHP